MRKIIINLKCLFVRRRFNEYLEDALSSYKKAAVRKHVKSCPECSRRLDELKNIMILLNLPKEKELPLGYNNSLHRKLLSASMENNRKYYPQPARILKPVFCGILAVFVLWGSYRLLDRRTSANTLARNKKNVINVHQEGQLRFCINAAKELKDATLEIKLPKEICLSEDPEPIWSEQIIYWGGQLNKGENLISFQVKGITKGKWIIKATLKNGISKTIDIPVEIT